MFSWTQIRDTDWYSDNIWLNTILTLEAKQLMITNKNNLCLHLKTL